jgi:hypothetical protein
MVSVCGKIDVCCNKACGTLYTGETEKQNVLFNMKINILGRDKDVTEIYELLRLQSSVTKEEVYNFPKNLPPTPALV